MNLWTRTKQLLREDEILAWEGFQVKVVRRRGMRSIVMRVETAGYARLVCPYRLPFRAIEKFLEDRRDWLKKQNDEMQTWQPWRDRCGKEGESYLYLGDELKLRDGVTVLKKPFVAATPAEGPLLYFYWPEQMLQQRHHSRARVFAEIQRHFEKKAEEILLERAAFVSEQMAIKPKLIRFRSQKSRWGSCSSRGHVSLNRRLIGAPVWVIDSVIVHEYSHLLHLNHSKAFWEVVEKYSPDHQQADQWLNENHFKLLPG